MANPITRWRGVSTRAIGALTLAVLAIAALAALRPAASADEGPIRPLAATVDPGIPGGAAPVDVVVQARAGVSTEALTAAVTGAGGTVVDTLPIIDGAAVRIPGELVDTLAGDPGVLAITFDRGVSFETVDYDESGTASSFVGSSGGYDAWNQGYLGEGVGVAVVDTGISEMNDFTGRLIHGPDLSGEGTLVDTYGHGTVMAGIVGGSGADSADNNHGAYTGVAPESHLVGVKAAGANGAADVSTLLQALHWVSAYQDQYDIRVLNLSWGTPSTQDPSVDPLNYAVERLWDQGIVVVAAAGNSGPESGTVTKPADTAAVLTVGAYDDKGSVNPNNDDMLDWSSRGPTADGTAKPDLVAPGRRLIATRSFGSTIANEHPRALIDPSYIRGSGTSQAAAVVSGSVALLLEARPDLTPDQVKHLLTSTADPLHKVSTDAQGAGRLDLAEALSADPGPASWQDTTSSGLGSLEASRGGWHVETDCDGDGDPDVIEGEIDVRCEEWNGSSWTGSSWTGSSWTGSSWTGSSWTGSSWTGSSWTGSSWTGSSWTGGIWDGSSWTGSSWTSDLWDGSSWTGSSWTGSSWTGSSWTGSSWTGSSWTTGEWDEDLFATAFWGATPPVGIDLPGEIPSVSTTTSSIKFL